MPYQMSSDFQTILDFSTLNQQKKLSDLEIEAKIAMASFAADAAKLANANANAVDVAQTLIGLRNELRQLDPADPIDKAVYDTIKQKMESYGVSIPQSS